MDSWKMVERCWRAQWRGFSPAEQAYMEQESERGHPTFIALGHVQYTIWSLERYTADSPCPLGARTSDCLISIKVDAWPEQFERDKEF